MNKKFLFFLLLSIPLLLSSNCKKPEIEPDDSGSWLRCKINGKDWEPSKGGDIMLDPVEATLINNNKNFFLKAYNKDGISLLIFDSSGVTQKEYILGDFYKGFYDNNMERDEFSTTEQYTGELNVTFLDKAKKQIKGTFHYKAWNPELKQEVHVTDGEFNIYYTTY